MQAGRYNYQHNAETCLSVCLTSHSGIPLGFPAILCHEFLNFTVSLSWLNMTFSVDCIIVVFYSNFLNLVLANCSVSGLETDAIC